MRGGGSQEVAQSTDAACLCRAQVLWTLELNRLGRCELKLSVPVPPLFDRGTSLGFAESKAFD